MISDNPAHAHLRDQALSSARRFARRPGSRHTISAVLVGTGASRSLPDAAPFMRRVAPAGGGRFVRANERASLSVTILRAIFDS